MMAKCCLFIWSAILVHFAIATPFDYTGYKVIRVTPLSSQQLDSIAHLDGRLNSVDFWRPPTAIRVPVDIFISPDEYSELESHLSSSGLSLSVLIEDVQSLIESNENAVNRRSGNWTEDFHTYEEIVEYFEMLSSSNGLVKMSVIGTTYENNSIHMATISSGNAGDNSTKNAIYVECCMHAREWIATSTCLFIADRLVSLYGTDPEITYLLNTFDWLITPVSNPDGYKYSWTNNRLWRKNRRPNANSTCIGVDSNRNFDANFGGIGSDSNPCSETYSGEAAFSEAESQAMRDVLLANQLRVKATVSIHSNAQLWISPYGYTSDLPADYSEMERVMKAGVAALGNPYGTNYIYGPGSEVLYFTSGTTKDYVYDTLGITHGYTLELRNSPFGFVPPADDIIPVATEAWSGLKAMAFAIAAV